MVLAFTYRTLCISIPFCLFAMVIGVTCGEEFAADNTLMEDANRREKRSLVFPYAPLLQLNFAITVPFQIPSRPLQLSWGYQLNFILPKNSSDLYPKVHRARRDASMATSFLELEGMLLEHGFKGRECLLRSICELAESPLEWDDHGVLEELLHALLTPSVSVTSYERFSLRPFNHDVSEEARFLEAEQRGSSGGDCVLSYPDCVQSPLELFTQRISTWG